ncbi:PH domain-containing protein [Salinicoccus sp. HZC-1]|uniref:PH domain-containing protein n=1 Tax=Salinicoccus sp. HZC-1 TaxID=3385497 RepID=UPI00398A555A
MEKISPKAIKVWRIRESIIAGIILIAALTALILSLWVWEWIPLWVPLVIFAFFLYGCIFQIWLFPKLQYKYFRYQVQEDEIKIHSGIWVKKQISVPLFRVQNIDTHVGPLMRRFGLKSITLRTSAERVEIPELEADKADSLRNDIRTLINENTRREI